MSFCPFLKSFHKLKKTEKFFFTVLFISFFFSIYVVIHHQPMGSTTFLIGIITLILVIIILSIYQIEKYWLQKEILMFILLLYLATHLPIYFVGTARIAISKKLNDDIILKIDELILGYLFPKGQFALYIDQNNILGPNKPIGKFINNTLQICYFFYYLIPYISMYVMLYANCVKETIYRCLNNGKISMSYNRNWNNILFLFGVYHLTLYVVFTINSLIPAGSPRIHIKQEFQNPLILTGFAKFLNRVCKDSKSANSFPSGHVAEPLSIALSLFGIKWRITGTIVLICTILMWWATLFLRYHYFIDIVFSILIAMGTYCIGRFFGKNDDDNDNLVEEEK